MDLRMLAFENPLLSTLHQELDHSDLNHDNKASTMPSRAYVHKARAMAVTPTDLRELPRSYAFVVNMPGIKSRDIDVQVEDESMLVISGERKREKHDSGKYVLMERRISKFMRKFHLPKNVDVDKVAAVCKDGVLSMTVKKVPPSEPKKPKIIEVKIA